jgi:probable HAF family extracellular repeat protein
MSTLKTPEFSMLLAALGLCASASQSMAQTYSVTDLGTLPGNAVSQAAALNDAGEAAGVSSGSTGEVAVIFDGGKVTDISRAGNTVSPTAINASGEIAGYKIIQSHPNSEAHAFLYSNGKMTNITSASLFPAGTEAYGIDNSGEVVGTGYLSASNFHAFLYSRGKMTDLGPSGAYQATAYAINTSGQIVGTYALNSGASGTFLYTDGMMTLLPAASSSSTGYGSAINDKGEIAGYLFVDASYHAAQFSNGIWTDLGTIPGAGLNVAQGINLSGQIVGTSRFPSTYKPFRAGKQVPFVSTASGLVDLNTLIPSGTGFTLTEAAGPMQVVTSTPSCSARETPSLPSRTAVIARSQRAVPISDFYHGFHLLGGFLGQLLEFSGLRPVGIAWHIADVARYHKRSAAL